MSLLDLHAVLSPRLAARFERTMAAEAGEAPPDGARALGAGLFDAALVAGAREQVLRQTLGRKRDPQSPAAMRALGAAALGLGNDLAIRESNGPLDLDLIDAVRIAPQRWGAGGARGGFIVGHAGKVPGLGAIVAGATAVHPRLASANAVVSEVLDLASTAAGAIARRIGLAAAVTWLIAVAPTGAATLPAATLPSVVLALLENAGQDRT